MYIQGSQSKCAFVSTNSVCQGEQVYLLWNPIFSLNIKIYFGLDKEKEEEIQDRLIEN